MDFACKQISLDEVLKCSLGITKAQLKILHYLEDGDWVTAEMVAKKLKLDTSTVQRALKALTEKGVADRHQENLDAGGYVYVYRHKGKDAVAAIALQSINSWVKRVEKELKQ